MDLARGFIGGHPVLLLDGPAASLDPRHREVAAGMIQAATARSGILHGAAVQNAVADSTPLVHPHQEAA